MTPLEEESYRIFEPVEGNNAALVFGSRPNPLHRCGPASGLRVWAGFAGPAAVASSGIAEKVALDNKGRADAAEGENWDPSVQMLAGGFPDVIRGFAEDIDATEALGDAVLAQPDDVLDAVQRLRARAAAAGNLESNEQQVVETTDDMISIAPASPEVVYVPQYDPVAAYYPAANGASTGTLLTTGVVAFGSALLIGEIFDDDDDWNDYWYGPPPFDWDDNAFYPGGIDVDGDVNIDIDRALGDRIDEADINLGDRERIGERGERIGDQDGSARDRAGAFQASPERREAARQKIAGREGQGDAATQNKLRARSGGVDSGARASLAAAAARRPPATMPSLGDSMLKPGRQDPAAVRRASDRGAYSLDPSRSGANFGAGAGRSIDPPKSASRPTQSRPAMERSPPRSSAFKQHSGGSRAQAASSRGRSSGGRRGGGGGGGGRRR